MFHSTIQNHSFQKTCKGSAVFGFNGKEKDDEWNGTSGGALDFGARIYDSRLGRWMSIDPMFNLYPGSSGYSSFANSPLIIIDMAGCTLKLVTQNIEDLEAAQNSYISLVQTAFNNKVDVSIYDGMIFFKPTQPFDNFTTEELNAYKTLREVQTSNVVLTQTIVNNDNGVRTDAPWGGVEDTPILDIGDVKSFGNNQNSLTSLQTLIHATYEGYIMKKSNKTDRWNRYTEGHDAALIREQAAGRLKRFDNGGPSYLTQDDGSEIEVNIEIKYDQNLNNPEVIVTPLPQKKEEDTQE